MIRSFTLGLAVVACMALTAPARADVNVGADALFTSAPLGIFGNWTIANTSDGGVQISQVQINLGTAASSLFFDPTFAPPGSLLPFEFTIFFGGGDTGFASVTGDGDGDTLLTLTFDDFDPGEIINFELDTDNPGRFLSTSASLTTGAEFAGTTFEVTFSGGDPEIEETTLSTQSEQIADLVDFARIEGVAPIEQVVPEPASVLAWSVVGLIGVGIARRYRRSRKASR